MPISHLGQFLQSGEFVVTVEVGPPRGADHLPLILKTRIVKDFCDAVNIPDNPRRIPRMSSIAGARVALDTGVEPILQMAMRDRNRVAFMSDLYGAYVLGIRNVLFVTGDLPGLGSDTQAKVVSDIDSIQALRLATRMMAGKDHSDEEIEGVPDFFLGATFDPFVESVEHQIQRTKLKHESGAQFFQTQAVFNVNRFGEFVESLADLNAYILAGVVPLRGLEMAEFMTEHVAGITIPDVILQRLDNAAEGLDDEEKEKAVQQEGLSIAAETINSLKKIDGVDGVHIMAVGWESCVPELVNLAGLYPRPG
ncbi:MAG: methylenetetrahydrofolate reductase [Candidatus Thorarchaeota archaeon]